MRICFSLSNLELGGAQVFVCRLANHLAEKGHEIFIYDHWPEYRDNGMAAIIGSRVTLLSFCENRFLRWLIWKLNALLKVVGLNKSFRHSLNQKSFFRQMKKHNVDVVNSHMLFSDDVITGFDKSFDFRIVVSFHGEYELFIDAGVSKEARRTLENVTRKASALIVTADKNLLAFPTAGSQLPPFFRIDVGLDPGAITKKPVSKAELGFGDRDLVVGMVSRGIPEKGWDTGIEVISRYNATHQKKVKLIMIGNGSYLRTLFKEKGTADMRLLQFEDQIQDYFSYYQLFDAFLFPTRFPGESFPNVVIESLYWGVPVIASNIGSIAQMIAVDGKAAGILIDPTAAEVVEEFTKALEKVVDNDMLRSEMAVTAKLAFRKFDINLVAEKYLDVFRKVL